LDYRKGERLGKLKRLWLLSMKLVRFSIILIVGCLHFWGVGRRRRRKTKCVLRDVNDYYSDYHLFSMMLSMTIFFWRGQVRS